MLRSCSSRRPAVRDNNARVSVGVAERRGGRGVGQVGRGGGGCGGGGGRGAGGCGAPRCAGRGRKCRHAATDTAGGGPACGCLGGADGRRLARISAQGAAEPASTRTPHTRTISAHAHGSRDACAHCIRVHRTCTDGTCSCTRLGPRGRSSGPIGWPMESSGDLSGTRGGHPSSDGHGGPWPTVGPTGGDSRCARYPYRRAWCGTPVGCTCCGPWRGRPPSHVTHATPQAVIVIPTVPNPRTRRVTLVAEGGRCVYIRIRVGFTRGGDLAGFRRAASASTR